MTLPSRLAKKKNRSERWTSQGHRTFVRGHHCCVPGCQDVPIEVAHVRTGSDAGMGRKPSDWFCISLCKAHHTEQHAIGEATFATNHRIDLHALANEFAQASPKWPEIDRERRESGFYV